jgi:hypothetical protein
MLVWKKSQQNRSFRIAKIGKVYSMWVRKEAAKCWAGSELAVQFYIEESKAKIPSYVKNNDRLLNDKDGRFIRT